MSRVSAFRALRPKPEAVARVASVPYDVVSTNEAKVLAHDNPLSALHISRAEIDLPADTDPYSSAVYEQAATNFSLLKSSAPLIVEEQPSLYIYRLRMGTHEQIGVAGCYSLDDYDKNVIRKHEHTRREKEDDRTHHMLELRAQMGPVFLTYRASTTVDALVSTVVSTQPPLFDFMAPDQVQHTLWRAEASQSSSLVAAFEEVPTLYIADGHHRAASASRVRHHLRDTYGRDGKWDMFLAVAFPDAQVQILPYNRVVKDLGPHTRESFLTALHERGTVRDGNPAEPQAGEVSMYLGDRWYSVSLEASPSNTEPASRLDVSRLHNQILSPLLGVGNAGTDKRVDFIGGVRGLSELKRLVDSKTVAVAFAMHAVNIGDLLTVSDLGGIMPPKSTWFEPKLRDGLLFYLI